MTDSETVHARPTPRRPDTGLLAWQSTLGYISATYTLDAMLTIQVKPLVSGSNLAWEARATWGRNTEEVLNRPSLAAALNDLWIQVDRNNVIFESLEDAARSPIYYAESEWLDPDTQTTLDRLIQLNWTVFNTDWMLVIVYQPVAIPNARVQTRLLAKSNTVQTSGRGATVRDACHDLYRNAARDYTASNGKPLDVHF
jgi:hypothetical protein